MKFKLLLFFSFSFLLLNCTSSRVASLFGTTNECSESRFNKVDMSSYYEALGVIIPKEYDEADLLWVDFNREHRFTPNVQDIQKAEEILFNGYNKVRRNRNFNITGSDSYQDIRDVQLYLKNYPRQYLGYINNEGDRIILINLLREKESRIQRKQMHCWNNSFVVVVDESGRGTTFYRANLEAETLE